MVYLLRSVQNQSIITTIAGVGSLGYSGDGSPATSSTFWNPCAVAIDSSDNVYIADNGNHRVRKVTVSTGIISTIAGSGATATSTGSYSGDGGAATSATLNYPGSVTVDTTGIQYSH